MRLAAGEEPTADDSVVGHDLEVDAGQDITATSGGDEDLTNLGSLLHGGDLVASHGSLESIDWINLSNQDTGTHATEGLSTTLANIAESSNNSNLASNHYIGSTLDTVNEGLTATVQIVELGLGDTVVDVDGGHEELVVLEHAIQVVDTSGGLLRDTIAALEHLGVFGVDEAGQVATVVKDQVELGSVLEGKQLLLEAPVVFLLGLALPGKNRNTGSGDGGGGMVLGAEDVAAGPGDFGSKSSQGLDEDSGLDSHVQAASNAGTLERLVGGVLLPGRHETGHLVLGELDLLAAEGSQRQVSDLELLSGRSHCDGGYVVVSERKAVRWMGNKRERSEERVYEGYGPERHHQILKDRKRKNKKLFNQFRTRSGVPLEGQCAAVSAEAAGSPGFGQAVYAANAEQISSTFIGEDWEQP